MQRRGWVRSMQQSLGLVGVVSFVLAGCADNRTGPTANNAPVASDSTPRTSEVPTMTNTDPKSPQAWTEAAAIAQKTAGAPVNKHSDALPFFFDAGTTAVLIHHGKLVGERGPVAAGGYLRDLGVIRGEGPMIDDVVHVLIGLEALPAVDKLPKDAFIHAGNPKLADVAPRIETDGQTAKIVLHYPLSGAPVQHVDPDPSHRRTEGSPAPGGSPTQSDMPVRVQPVARMSLTIPSSGDPVWTRENLNVAIPL